MNIRILISKTLKAVGIKRNQTIIDKVSLNELLPISNIEPIEKRVDNGNITLQELTIISQIVDSIKPKNIFEIGTFNGRTTMNLAHFSPNESKVYTLDLPKKDLGTTKFNIENGDKTYVDKEIIGERYENKDNKIVQLYGDSATFDFTPYYGKMDFVFVDGAHSAPYVKSDTEVAMKLIKRGGTILWHDYGIWKGVTKVMNNYFRNDSRFKNLKHINGSCFVYYR